MSAMTERCKDCVYYCNCDGHYMYPTCDYILMTGRRRGCPAGDECDKFLPAKDCLRFTNPLMGVVRLPIQEQQLVDLYEQGLPDGEIGKRVGLSRSAVQVWRHKRGLPSQQDLKRGVVCED